MYTVHPLLRARRFLRTAGAVLVGTLCGAALATDIADAPLFTNSAASVRPNIMFILDDSVSMDREYLPDLQTDDVLDEGTYGFKSSQCNGLAYDPKTIYKVPVNWDGSTRGIAGTGDLAIAAQLTDPRNVENIASMPTVGSTITVKLTSTSGASYTNGNPVTIYGDLGTFIVGHLPTSGTNYSSPNLTVVVKFASGIYPLTSAKIGKGTPAKNVYYTYTGSKPAMAYAYQTTGRVVTDDFYNQCNTTASHRGDANFKPVYASSGVAGPADGLTDAQNFANWKLHYKSRMLSMKAGVSIAFKDLDAKYRIGLTTLSSKNVTESTDFLDVNDFEIDKDKQKWKFYSKLWAATPPSTQSTPLRASLAKVGQYFAKKALLSTGGNQTYDPVQYSCQRNYAILSTDGYWNTLNETTSSPKYGPYQLDRTTKVGQQDGGGNGTKRPMFDGGSVTKTLEERWTRTETRVFQVDTPRLTTSTTTTGTITTTRTPQTQTTSVLVKDFNVGGGNMSRSGYVVTVNTNGPHNLQNNDTVNITGGNNTTAGWKGNGYVVTVVDSDTFRYNIAGNNGSAGNGTYTFDPAGALACPASQGKLRQTTATRDRTQSETEKVTSTTVTTSTSTVTQTRTYTFAKLRTIVSINGTVTSDATAEEPPPGTLYQTQTSSPATVVTGSSETTKADPVKTLGTPSDTTWVAGNPVVVGGCVPSAPDPQTGNGTPTVLSREPTAVSNTGPTTTNQTAVETELSVHSAEGPKTTTNKPDVKNGGTEDTLADVAMYYYMTDLRHPDLGNCMGAKDVDVCENNVRKKDGDPAHSYGDSATWQHMTTFTVGLGVNGQLKYKPDYFTDETSDFAKILSGAIDWPTPSAQQIVSPPSNVDDLWHAAVNGRGQYFSADNPSALTDSLTTALTKIDATPGSAAAASTSSLQPVQFDNDIYVAQFTTQEWFGDVLAYQINTTTGNIESTVTWSAKTELDKLVPANRNILFAHKDKTSTLLEFTLDELDDNGYEDLFKDFCDKPGLGNAAHPLQCAGYASSSIRKAANDPANMVAYLRGEQTHTYYRKRTAVLGDVINASPLFVGKPSFKYSDSSYQTFATTHKDRAAVVLVAANDGMLHAFDRKTGIEQWAFVPTEVMKNMYKLADENFEFNHVFYVDGSPQVGDIQVNSGTDKGKWRTIVVGGLNKGGRSYYALDLTDTATPKLLWEFKHDNLGLTFGNPIITRRKGGDWVVVFGSGYNNGSQTDGSPAGDGNGHLFVLDAYTGAQVMTVPTYQAGTTTAVGTADAPSGLAEINSWVDSELDNTSLRFYGGDLLGNVWRFDIDGNAEPKEAALQLAQLTTPPESGFPEIAQPITTKPLVAEVEHNGSKFPVVYVATGQYLGGNDVGDKNKQSFYAIKDPMNDTALGKLRGRDDMVVQTITAPDAAHEKRTSTSEKVDWLTKQGWRVDFPLAGERVSVNPQIALDTIFVGTNTPKDDACSAGGKSQLYEFNYLTGSSTATYLGDVLVQGLTLVQLTEGAGDGSIVTIITRSDGSVDEKITNPGTSGGVLRRSQWRELVD